MQACRVHVCSLRTPLDLPVASESNCMLKIVEQTPLSLSFAGASKMCHERTQGGQPAKQTFADFEEMIHEEGGRDSGDV